MVRNYTDGIGKKLWLFDFTKIRGVAKRTSTYHSQICPYDILTSVSLA